MKVTELLTAFSGQSAKRFEPFFGFSEQARIVGVEIHAVGVESTTVRYSGQERPKKETNNILRITTADGFEGVSGVDSFCEERFNEEHAQDLQSVAAELIALKTLDPVEVGAMLDREHPELNDASRSSIDIALWDLAARKARCPLHKLLGSNRDSIENYASLPFYDSLPEYTEAVNTFARHGYSAFKFHVWGSIDEDLKLVTLLQETFAGSDFRFMIDLEEKYGFKDALSLGERMDEGLFVWLEAPFSDGLLGRYAELRSKITVQLIPDGFSFYSPEFIKRGIEAGAWDAGRFDCTAVGGISKALELLIIANAAGVPMEIQSWGHSLAQAANLHVMLANERTRYFEAPMPVEAFEFGMTSGHTNAQGRAITTTRPGLGIEVNWEQLASADFYVRTQHGEG